MWYSEEPDRLAIEKEAIEERFPQFQLRKYSTGDLFWFGNITTRNGNDYTIEVRYPESYPYKPPKVFPVDPEISEAKHMYKDGSLCLFYPDDQSFTPNNTAATVIAWAAAWLHAYEVWKKAGRWPGDAVSH